jgi:hypothetical protein
MGAILAKILFKTGSDNIPHTEYKSLFDIPEVDIDGNKIQRLGDILTGKKAILVVNVVSK